MIIRTDPRNIIIIVMTVILFFMFDGCSRVAGLFESEEVIEEKSTTKTTVNIKERIFKDLQPFPELFKPEPQRVKIKDGKVEEIPETSTEEGEVVNKYETVSVLKNGTIKSKLLIRGELLSAEYELSTTDTIITKETETTKIVVKSSLMGVAGSTLGLDGRVKDIHGGLQYNHKNNWHVKIAPQYDVDPKIILPMQDRAGVMLEVGFKF